MLFPIPLNLSQSDFSIHPHINYKHFPWFVAISRMALSSNIFVSKLYSCLCDVDLYFDLWILQTWYSYIVFPFSESQHIWISYKFKFGLSFSFSVFPITLVGILFPILGLVLVKIPQRNRTNRIFIDIQKESYWEGLVHTIMEVEKSQHLPSTDWRPRRTHGVVPVQPRRPENQEYWCPTLSKGGCSTSSRKQIVFPLHFCSIQALIELYYAHLHWWVWYSLLSLPIHILFSSGSILTDTPRNNILPAIWLLLSPAKLVHKIDHCRSIVHNPFFIFPSPKTS